MFFISLKFCENKNKATQFMQAHKDWIANGFEDGVFLLVGSIEPNSGGAILAHNASISEIEKRVNEDPFVKENIVRAEIVEISPSMSDERLNFLLG